MTQPVHFVVALRAEFLVRGRFLVVWPLRQISFAMLFVENRTFPNIDRVACLAALGEFRIISDFALEAHVGDEALIGFWIETRQIAGVRVAVGIAVRHVEKEHEIEAMRKRGHLSHSLGAAAAVASFSVVFRRFI